MTISKVPPYPYAVTTVPGARSSDPSTVLSRSGTTELPSLNLIIGFPLEVVALLNPPSPTEPLLGRRGLTKLFFVVFVAGSAAGAGAVVAGVGVLPYLILWYPLAGVSAVSFGFTILSSVLSYTQPSSSSALMTPSLRYSLEVPKSSIN